jgi:hypothetical protein
MKSSLDHRAFLLRQAKGLACSLATPVHDRHQIGSECSAPQGESQILKIRMTAVISSNL